MKLYKTAGLLVVALGAAGLTTAQGCGGGGSSSGTGGTGAPLGQPPASPAGPPTTSTEARTFAINALLLGETDRTGKANPKAWKTYGYNLDKLVTDDKSTDVCQRQGGANAAKQVDGDNGIDNGFGSSILGFITVLLPAPSKALNDTIAAGTFTILLTVNGLTDDPAQTNTGLSGNIRVGGAVPKGTKPDFNNPAFDWPYNGDTPQVELPAAYITNGTFVNGAAGVDVSLTLVLSGQTLSLKIHKAIISFDHKTPNDLTNGTIAGVIAREELVAGIEKVAGSFNVCDGSTLETLKTTIRQASDILQDGTNRPGVPCDGISIGIGFTAKRVGLPKTPAVASTTAPVDKCAADGGTEAGTDGG